MKELTLSLIIAAVLVISCASIPAASATDTANFGDMQVGFSMSIPDKDWKLIEVNINGSNTGFRRNSLDSNGLSEVYTLNFNSEIVSGVGAPNRYTAPYTVGENNTISIALVRATLMASIFELAALKEYDFFSYIQNAYKWDIINENLELYSKLENGSEIKLVFSF
jgi:heat shock protein HslJ